MTSYIFTIRLTSDAEPGTGLGGETVNDYAPRDHLGQWTIPGSHIKGLIRQNLLDAVDRLGTVANSPWSERIIHRTLGRRDERSAGVEAAIRLSGAVAQNDAQPKFISRTAVNEDTGGAQDMSLRTTEAIPEGTTFEGVIHSSAGEGSLEDLAWRFGLLSIAALGGGRTRGAGSCVISLREEPSGKPEERTPGQLLKELHQSLTKESEVPQPDRSIRPTKASTAERLSEKQVVCRLTFQATTPVCCPEIADKTNVIRSGFTIPASAVQGVVLNRINAVNPALADQLFLSAGFRAWPLHPSRLNAEPGGSGELPVSATRVSLSHRVAKFSLSEGLTADHFRDAAIEPYDLRQGLVVPFKSADGVLLRYPNGLVRFWKAGDMPHVVTSHGVHNDSSTPDGRNLYTVDSMAPLIWEGLVVLPENAAEILLASLEGQPVQGMGKGRTVRGIGTLSMRALDQSPSEFQTPPNHSHTVLVVQSPLLLPDKPRDGQSSEDELRGLATEWAARHDLPEPNHAQVKPGSSKLEQSTWSNVGIRFGWNRHIREAGKSSGRLQACRVVLPGSVIVFPTRLDGQTLHKAVVAGIGEGRERGYGGVHVHPGRAVGLYPPAQAESGLPRKAPVFPNGARMVLEIHGSPGKLPSTSQIRALRQRLEQSGTEAAKSYLKSQTERTSRIWATWEPVFKEVNQLLELPQSEASRALVLLANLATIDSKEGGQ